MEAELGLIGAVWMELGRFGDAESWNRNNRAYMWYAGPCSLNFCCMHAVQRRQRSRQRNWIKTHPFYYTPLPPPHSHSHSLSAIWRRPSLLSKILSFFPYRKHAGRRGGGEKKKKNASEATRERERKQRKLVVEREGEERGVDQMEGRKEGKDLSKGSSAWLKDSAQINKYMNQSL